MYFAELLCECKMQGDIEWIPADIKESEWKLITMLESIKKLYAMVL